MKVTHRVTQCVIVLGCLPLYLLNGERLPQASERRWGFESPLDTLLEPDDLIQIDGISEDHTRPRDSTWRRSRGRERDRPY